MKTFGPSLPAFAELAPGVRRIVAPNPSMMTGPGTNTYLLGDSAVAVIDPGPAIAAHVEDIVEKAGAPIRWILVTHTHVDHSPAARTLAEETGATVYGMPAPGTAHQDRSFEPDTIVHDGDRLPLDGATLDVVHTPGHASNHVCYRHAELDWLFTGDHVIDGSTVVINPPDGNMKHYLESLERCRDLECRAIAPGHGDVIDDPAAVIEWIIAHRLEREAKVAAAVKAQPNHTSHELVPHVYADVAPHLFGWAERSLLAHLEKLEADGRATVENGRWRLVDGPASNAAPA